MPFSCGVYVLKCSQDLITDIRQLTLLKLQQITFTPSSRLDIFILMQTNQHTCRSTLCNVFSIAAGGRYVIIWTCQLPYGTFFLQLTVMCVCLSFSTYVYFVSVNKRSGISTGVDSVITKSCEQNAIILNSDYLNIFLFIKCSYLVALVRPSPEQTNYTGSEKSL